MKFDIRLATLEDVKCCADIHAKSWEFAYSGIVSKDIIDKHNTRWPMIWNTMLTNNTDSHYVVILDSIIIGFLTIAVYKTKPITIGKEVYALKHDFS